MEKIAPMDIERRSFEILTEELGRELPPDQAAIIKRVIHTSADFEYVDNMVFSADAVERALTLLRQGCDIVTDTQMAKAGINKTILGALGGEVHCFIADADVAEEAKAKGITRSAVSMAKAARTIQKPCIFAIGNAPTALIQLEEMVREGSYQPALIIGVPVGFVNVVESKELIMALDIPHIVAKGRKGGSNVAAAILNALLYTIKR